MIAIVCTGIRTIDGITKNALMDSCLDIQNSNNTAGSEGGAVSIQGEGLITLNGANFHANSADVGGGKTIISAVMLLSLVIMSAFVIHPILIMMTKMVNITMLSIVTYNSLMAITVSTSIVSNCSIQDCLLEKAPSTFQLVEELFVRTMPLPVQPSLPLNRARSRWKTLSFCKRIRNTTLRDSLLALIHCQLPLERCNNASDQLVIDFAEMSSVYTVVSLTNNHFNNSLCAFQTDGLKISGNRMRNTSTLIDSCHFVRQVCCICIT